MFGSKCYTLNDWENLGKFDAESDEGIFLGYSTTSWAYRVFNKRTKTVMESIATLLNLSQKGWKKLSKMRIGLSQCMKS